MQFRDKIILVTGASRGIGRAICEEYIKEGAKIIALARNVKLLEELDDYAKNYENSITIVPFDLRETEKIDSLGKYIYQKFGRLDIFIGNAAIIGTISPLTHTEDKTWDDVIKINLTANFKLIKSLEFCLNLSKSPKAIFVSSKICQVSTAYWGAYSISKKALEHMVEIYRQENQKIEVKILRISEVMTDMLKQSMPGLAYDSSITRPEVIARNFLNSLKDDDLVAEQYLTI